MKVILDISRKLHTLKTGQYSGTGIDRVLLAYITHYRGKARAFIRDANKNRIYSQKVSNLLFDYVIKAAKSPKELKPSLLIKILLHKSDHNKVAGSVFVHLDQYPHDFTLLKQLNIPIIYMIHDLIPQFYPDYHIKDIIEEHTQFVKKSIYQGSGIITNSENTLNDLRTYHSDLEIPLPPTLAASLASGLEFNNSPGTRQIQEPYYVVISTIEVRKNHLLLLNIWRRLVERYSMNTPKLVLIGKRGWKTEQAINLLDNCEKIRPFIIEESACSDQKIVAYLHHAQALLFPSFTEGYGLPLIEALSNSTPAIVSDIPVFREIAGDIPEYIDPLDAIKWMNMIEAYSKQDSSLRNAQLKRLHSFQAPTWKDHFDKVDAFLQNIAEKCT